MSSTPVRWLAEQLPAWEREGIVTADGARLLRERYAAEPRGGLPQMIVAAIGALLIGTGLIAVLAYNWDDFPRWVRLSLALGPLAASQAASWWVLQRGAAATRWQREAVALLQALAVGAAMALVSQIYNLPGQWTDLVFWWCVVAVPLAWVLESDAVAIAYLLGIATWTIAQARPFTGEGADCRIWYPLLLAGILPRWPGADLRGRPQPGSRAVLALSALAGLIAVAADSRQRLNSDHASVWLTMLTAAAVLLFPLDRRGIAEPLSRKPQVLLGGIVLVTLALVASFEDPARGLLEGVAQAMPLGWCWLLLTVVAAFAALALWQGRYAVVAVAALAVVPLVADADGLSRIESLSLELVSGPTVIRLVAGRGWREDDAVTIKWPFDRFYLNERLAPDADRLVAERFQEGNKPVAECRLLDGRAVLTDILVDGTSIREVVRQQNR